MSRNTSSSALVAREEQKDETVTNAQQLVLPFHHVQGRSEQDPMAAIRQRYQAAFQQQAALQYRAALRQEASRRQQASLQRQASLQQQAIQGDDETFWWQRLDMLTTLAAQAPHFTSPEQSSPVVGYGLFPIVTARGRVFAEHQLPRAPETGVELLNERANNEYLDLIKTDPRLTFNDYTSTITTPGRWSYALPTHAALAQKYYGRKGKPLEAGDLRYIVKSSPEWRDIILKDREHDPTIVDRTPDLPDACEIYDHGIEIVWIPVGHPLHATHQINLLDNHKQALNRLMTYPPNYAQALQALITTMQAPPLTSSSIATIPEDWPIDMTSSTKKSNTKEWKPAKDCKVDDCIQLEDYKKFVLECQFDGYGKYIDRFDNDLPEEYLNHLCTCNMALKWQQQCRRREINKGATQYGEVEKGGPRYDELAIDFLKLWWYRFRGHYHKDDLFEDFSTTFPDQKREKEALSAQANRVAAKIIGTGSRAGTHVTTSKDDPSYVRNLTNWREDVLSIWKRKVDMNNLLANSKQPKPQKRKHKQEADQDEMVEQSTNLKHRRKNRACAVFQLFTGFPHGLISGHVSWSCYPHDERFFNRHFFNPERGQNYSRARLQSLP